MKNLLTNSDFILDVRGSDITQVDAWINQHNLTVDKDYTYTLMDVFPPCFRYYFKCPQQHLMAVLSHY